MVRLQIPTVYSFLESPNFGLHNSDHIHAFLLIKPAHSFKTFCALLVSQIFCAAFPICFLRPSLLCKWPIAAANSTIDSLAIKIPLSPCLIISEGPKSQFIAMQGQPKLMA